MIKFLVKKRFGFVEVFGFTVISFLSIHDQWGWAAFTILANAIVSVSARKYFDA